MSSEKWIESWRKEEDNGKEGAVRGWELWLSKAVMRASRTGNIFLVQA